jgi:hypothetical protein
LTEIYLCHACSCQEILSTETAGQGRPAPRQRRVDSGWRGARAFGAVGVATHDRAWRELMEEQWRETVLDQAITARTGAHQRLEETEETEKTEVGGSGGARNRDFSSLVNASGAGAALLPQDEGWRTVPGTAHANHTWLPRAPPPALAAREHYDAVAPLLADFRASRVVVDHGGGKKMRFSWAGPAQPGRPSARKLRAIEEQISLASTEDHTHFVTAWQ